MEAEITTAPRTTPVPAGTRLPAFYEALRDDHGTLGWWPGRTRLEVIVGAILTQNTAWTNVEKAIARLRERGWLKLPDLAAAPESDLAEAIRPSGYFRQKARKIRFFLDYLERRHGGSLSRMAAVPTETLREDLLAIWGIGPETADSILLYAFGRPVFVVDAYTHRILRRHGIHPGGGYAEVQGWFERHLPQSAELYNDFHAQIVWAGKQRCRSRPRCEGCPLEPFLPPGGPDLTAEKPKRNSRALVR